MTILYDYQQFYNQKSGGASRIYAELIRELPKLGQLTSLGLSHSNNQYLNSIEGIQFPTFKGFEDFMGGIHFRGKLRIYQSFLKYGLAKNYDALNKQASVDKLKEQQFDVFHPTFYDDYFLDYLGNKPFVLTILDMINEKFRHDDIGKKQTLIKKKLADRADRIIAISENTKKDAVEILGISPEKIDVTHLGNSIFKNPNSDVDPLSLPEKYVLYVGGRTDYKNFNRFFKAMQPILKKDRDLRILCTGFPFTPQERLMFSVSGLGDRMVHIFAKESTFSEIYQRAICFIYPTLYEGFGIPVVEALANGCPVITSYNSSIPEVGGDAVLYFNPESEQNMTENIEHLLSDESLRSDLVQKGLVQAQKFTWAQTAEATLASYQKII